MYILPTAAFQSKNTFKLKCMSEKKFFVPFPNRQVNHLPNSDRKALNYSPY